ncbi:MAG: hypothetical protein H0W53_09295 [Acidobacteria bacterium]|nr:hypothetical protein [Acidobacteriota bacterium]
MESTTEYTAVVTATPIASERMANEVKRGVASSRRAASLRSATTGGFYPFSVTGSAGPPVQNIKLILRAAFAALSADTDLATSGDRARLQILKTLTGM